MFRLLMAFAATAMLVALIDAVVVANTCTPTVTTFTDNAAFFPKLPNAGNAGEFSQGIVFAQLEGRARGSHHATNNPNPTKSKLLASSAAGGVGSPNFTTTHNTANLTQVADFTVIYTPFSAGGPNAGRMILTVKYAGWNVSETFNSSVNTQLTTTATVIGFHYKGATKSGSASNSNRVTTSLTISRVNQLGYTPFSPLASTPPPPGTQGSNNGETHHIYLDCVTANSGTTIEGTVTFVWANNNTMSNRPMLTVAVGAPAKCCNNQRVVLKTMANGKQKALCGCWGDLELHDNGYCVCPNSWQVQTDDGVCQDPVPPIRKCLTMPFIDEEVVKNSMISQVDEMNNNDLPAKAHFTETGYGPLGLRVSAVSFSDGLETARFAWIGTNGNANPACSAIYKQPITAASIVPYWDDFDGQLLMGNETLQQAVDTEDVDEWSDLGKVFFDLRVAISDLSECGFEPIVDTEDRYYADDKVTYRNTMCGEFKYSECYSDAWGFVQVPTEVKTCYLVMVEVPRSVSAEAHVTLVDQQKVDMRFSSITNCAAGPGPNNLWGTELVFKTIVQFPYTVTNVTVKSLNNAQTNHAQAVSPNRLCDQFSEYKNFSVAEAGFDQLDTGGLQDNSYCRQDWTLNNTQAYVQSAIGTCGPKDVDEFEVTVTGTCQHTIDNSPDDQHIACADDATFSYSTVIQVPRVCMETIPLELEDFRATLKLYKTLDPTPTAAALYTPNSTLCGQMTITPEADNQIDEDWLKDYVLEKVEVYYTSMNNVVQKITSSGTGLTHNSSEVITLSGGGQAWVGSFCMKVDAAHVPGLLHSVDANGHDLPDVTTISNGISIFQRCYTVRATAVLRPNNNNNNRRLRTRVDRLVAEAKPNAGQLSRAEAEFDVLDILDVDSAPTTTVSSEGGAAGVKDVSPESAQVQGQSKQGSGLADGAKIGIGVGVGIGALAALVIAAVVMTRRRAA